MVEISAAGNDGATEDIVEAYRHSGDPLADDAVRSVFDHLDGEFTGIAAVTRLLDDILDLERLPSGSASTKYGPGYQRYLDESLRLPSFYDDAKAASSVRWFEQYGWTAFSILGCASLPEGYAIAEVTRVLGTTQALTAHTQRRLWETIQYVVDTMDSGGIAVDPDRPGFASGPGAWRTQKVRLFHATIRFLLTHPPAAGATSTAGAYANYGELLLRRRWEPNFGTPINQAQMSGTILSFSYIVLRGLTTIGYELDDELAEAYLYRWNVIGHLMGVDHDLLRWTYPEAQVLFDHLRRPDLTDDGRALTASLIGFMQDQIPPWLVFARPTVKMLIVDLIGTEHARDIGVELPLWHRAWLVPMRGAMTLYARVFAKTDVLQWATSWLYLRMRKHMIGAPQDGRRRFRLPTSAPDAKAWLSARQPRTPQTS